MIVSMNLTACSDDDEICSQYKPQCHTFMKIFTYLMKMETRQFLILKLESTTTIVKPHQKW